MAGFNFRLFKKIPIIPGVFWINITKSGLSYSLNLGPYSRTWGKRGTTTTIDAPGTFGLSWRRDQRKSKKKAQELEGPRERSPLAIGTFWLIPWTLAMLAWNGARPVLQACTQEGNPLRDSLILGAALVIGGAIVCWLIANKPNGSFRYFLLLTILGVLGLWLLPSAWLCQ